MNSNDGTRSSRMRAIQALAHLSVPALTSDYSRASTNLCAALGILGVSMEELHEAIQFAVFEMDLDGSLDEDAA